MGDESEIDSRVAVMLSAERIWEVVRDTYDAFLVDAGASQDGVMVIPPWSALSPESKDLFLQATGYAMSPLMAAIMLIDEVRFIEQ